MSLAFLSEIQQQMDAQVDLVIVFCKGHLDWLDDLSLPAKHRILVYLKCSKNPSIHSFCKELHCIPAMFVDQRGDGAMQSSDECGGYLLHIHRYFADLSDWTVFLQDDAPRHLHLAYLNMVLKLMASGTFVYHLPGEFLHLNNDRHLLYWTPCLDSVMKVLGLPSARLLATYCCSQFVVHRNQILKRGLAFFQKAADLLKNNFEDIAGCKYESNRSSASSMRSEWNIFADLRQERLAGGVWKWKRPRDHSIPNEALLPLRSWAAPCMRLSQSEDVVCSHAVELSSCSGGNKSWRNGGVSQI